MTGCDRIVELRSDNSAGVSEEILDAVGRANSGGAAAYGADEWTERARRRVAEVFERSDVSVFPVVSGTAANAIALATLCPPWGAVLCHDSAHVLQSECAATSMFSGGATIRGIPGDGWKTTPDAVEAAFRTTRWGDPHHSQPTVLSLTNPTDMGTVYSPDEIAALAETAATRGLRVHLDGARLANAIVTLGCSPAEVTWRAGVDVVSLGATKNGALSTDAIVSFDRTLDEQLTFRLKRAGHVPSKMRFQSAQIEAYLTDDLWLRLAGAANRTARALADGLGHLGVQLAATPQANMVFANIAAATADVIEAAGVHFHRAGGPGTVRFVTSFATTDEDITLALSRVAAAVRA
jgi:threonine aldolase